MKKIIMFVGLVLAANAVEAVFVSAKGLTCTTTKLPRGGYVRICIPSSSYYGDGGFAGADA